jgi:hypothetical protein
VDENAAAESTGKRDVIDETRYFTLAETDAGWAIWDRTRASEEPVIVFPADEDGFVLASHYFTKANREARIQHGPWLGPLRWAAFISGGLWVALNAILQVHFYVQADRPTFSPNNGSHFFAWIQVLNSIASSAFLVAVGAYVILWLRIRAPAEAGRP